jgi:hypothetical protein
MERALTSHNPSSPLTAFIPQPDTRTPEELAAARQQTRESALHATDLALRRVSAFLDVWMSVCISTTWGYGGFDKSI